MDESEEFNYGQYETYEEALVEAKKIVDGYIEHYWKPETKPEEFLSGFAHYGEEPVILPNEPGEFEKFSARTYLERRIKELGSRIENK